MSYLSMVSVLASVDGGQLASTVENGSSTDRVLSCERNQVKTYFTHLNKEVNVFTVFTLAHTYSFN